MELWLCMKISWAYTRVTILQKSDLIVKVLEDVIMLDLWISDCWITEVSAMMEAVTSQVVQAE